MQEVTPEEARRLQRITKTSKQPIRMRLAIVVMASAQRRPVPAIARLMQVSEAYVRQVIHDFNERGFEALDPQWSAGEFHRDVVAVARKDNASSK